MKTLSDVANETSGTDDDGKIDCGYPHDHDDACDALDPRRGRECSRERGHDGPHTHCGEWNCKYLVWTDDGEVVFDHFHSLIKQMREVADGT